MVLQLLSHIKDENKLWDYKGGAFQEGILEKMLPFGILTDIWGPVGKATCQD